ncbi:hypothetical protein [Gracilinema caldarium]|nr:hypothetical protein [Gracilinema caldarium]MCA1950519.1 hypothetical protein [Treponema sp.]
MRQLVFVLIALLAVVTFIRAYDVPSADVSGNQALQGKITVQNITANN